MALRVTATPIGKKLNQLLIFDDKTFIGEYERSQKADIARKKREIQNAEELLLTIFRNHKQPFVVRWDGAARAKSIRVNGVEVNTIPKSMWETPSWQ